MGSRRVGFDAYGENTPLRIPGRSPFSWRERSWAGGLKGPSSRSRRSGLHPELWASVAYPLVAPDVSVAVRVSYLSLAVVRDEFLLAVGALVSGGIIEKVAILRYPMPQPRNHNSVAMT